jgi:hypothetical protein
VGKRRSMMNDHLFAHFHQQHGVSVHRFVGHSRGHQLPCASSRTQMPHFFLGSRRGLGLVGPGGPQDDRKASRPPSCLQCLSAVAHGARWQLEIMCHQILSPRDQCSHWPDVSHSGIMSCTRVAEQVQCATTNETLSRLQIGGCSLKIVAGDHLGIHNRQRA